MTERIKKLRTRSLEAKPTISAERARLMTEFYKRPGTAALSAPMQHALAFKHVMENKTICIDDGELIVGALGSFEWIPGPVGQALKLSHDPATLTSDSFDGAYVALPYRLTENGT
ncbi:MAG TPA: hypothetical protein ENO03_01980, partial [Candidatus Aminicenantes bacterium]|nr:hypothetical protein [Candidatus Aminicenantes bacterium]